MYEEVILMICSNTVVKICSTQVELKFDVTKPALGDYFLVCNEDKHTTQQNDCSIAKLDPISSFVYFSSTFQQILCGLEIN